MALGFFIVAANNHGKLRSEIGYSQFKTPGGSDLEVYLSSIFEIATEHGNSRFCRVPFLYTFGSDICFEPFQYRYIPTSLWSELIFADFGGCEQ